MFYASHQEGQGLTEYAFLLILVAIAILVIGNVYSQITTCLPAPSDLCQ